MAKEEVAWWIKIKIKPWSVHSSVSLACTSTNRRIQERMGEVYQRIRTESLWSKTEQEYHENLLEQLSAVKFVILTFSKMMNFKSVHIQVDNQTTLSYLLKIGGQRVRNLKQFQKRFGNTFSFIRTQLLQNIS